MNLPEFIDGYEVLEQIGAGSSAVVYKVRDKNGEIFALKLFHVGLNLAGSFRKRFLSEARTLEKFSSARTARLFRAGETASSPYLLMEFVEGKPLDQLLENGPLTGLQLQSTIAGLVEALSDTHASGITHRDLKPANVIVGPEGVKVIDFGLSAVEDANASTRSVISGGTPAWLSPEQAIGKDVGPSSDIFSLGLVIAFLSTGKNPFGQGKPDALIYRIVNESPDLDAVPGSLRQIVEACLRKDPSERPGIAQIAAYLSEIDSGNLESDQTLVASKTLLATFGEVGQADKGPRAKTLGRQSMSSPAKVGLAAIALVGLVAGLALFPAQGELKLTYLNESERNDPIFDSSLLVAFEDRSTRQISLPVGRVPEFSESVGQWTAGEEIMLSIENEVPRWSSKETTVEIPRFFSIFRAGQSYHLTLVLSDDQTDFYASWRPALNETDRTQNHLAFARRSNEASYQRQRIQERRDCVARENSRIIRLVGASTEFLSQYTDNKDSMMRSMPNTLSHLSYRSRLYDLAEKMFERQLATTSPERNGNASELSEPIILSVRDVYTAHFDLIELVEWVGDSMVNQPRYSGVYNDLYAREFAVWQSGENNLRTVTTQLNNSIRDQARFVCYSQFPELD